MLVVDNEKSATRMIAKTWVDSNDAVISLLMKYGVSIKEGTTKGMAISKMLNLLRSNNNFQKDFLEIARKSGAYKNMTGDYHNLFDPSIISSVSDFGKQLFGGIKSDSSVTNQILALETAKANKKEDNSIYWIAGLSIVGIFAIGGLIIYEKMK